MRPRPCIIAYRFNRSGTVLSSFAILRRHQPVSTKNSVLLIIQRLMNREQISILTHDLSSSAVSSTATSTSKTSASIHLIQQQENLCALSSRCSMLPSLFSFGGQIIGQNRNVFKSCNSLYNKQDRVFGKDNG